MPYHIYLDRKGDKHTEYIADIPEDLLQARFLRPYKTGGSITARANPPRLTRLIGFASSSRRNHSRNFATGSVRSVTAQTSW